MNSKIIFKKAFGVGFLLGFAFAFIPPIDKVLNFVAGAFYDGNLSNILFAVVWGVIFGSILTGSYAVLLKEGWKGLVRIGIVIGLLIFLFYIALTSSFGVFI